MALREGLTCPVCGEGHLVKKSVDFTVEYKGHALTIPDYQVYACDACEEEFVDPADAKVHDKKIVALHRSVDELLTPDEIRRIRGKFGLTQKQFAELLRLGEKNFARYESAGATQGRSTDWLLRILDALPEAIAVIQGAHSQADVVSVPLDLSETFTYRLDIPMSRSVVPPSAYNRPSGPYSCSLRAETSEMETVQ